MNPNPKPSATDTIDAVAAQWLARRDRGLTAIEQDAYLQWLREDPRHGATITRLEKVWGVLDQLAEWRPKHSPQPNPDLLAPKRRGRIYWLSTAACAAAAAIALLLFVGLPRSSAPVHRQAIIHPGPERLALEDGSVIELNAGAKVEVNYTPEERRVQLVQGEAHFIVAKNHDRPFIVSADKVSVRAVGTAFNVALDRKEVSVLVTEGTVQVVEHPESAAPAAYPPAGSAETQADGPVPTAVSLTVNQQTVIPLAANVRALPDIQELTPAQMERSLSWQGLRLEFREMALRDVVAEFNRYNRQKLVVNDRDTAAIVVAGTFRADNVEAFVRLLGTDAFGVNASPRGDEIVLRKNP
jgi:transmembrane sensor